MKLFIFTLFLMYVILGLIWYISDTSMDAAVHDTPGTTRGSRIMSRAIFVLTWPYWLYVNLRLCYAQYKAMNEIMNHRKGDRA